VDDELPERTEFMFTASASELAVIIRIMEAGGLGTWASVIHVALGKLALALDVEVPADALTLRNLTRAKKTS
jgi:hypothetical protein